MEAPYYFKVFFYKHERNNIYFYNQYGLNYYVIVNNNACCLL